MSVATVRRVVSRLGPDHPATDADLVSALVGADREAAFAELVARYAPMVLGVCRRVLADAHDAEDAFQAVFLVLARKFGAINPPGTVGGWLYGVAVRTARKAKTAASRRRRREMATAEAGRRAPAGSTVENADLRAVIDAELAALPEQQRAAVVLCDLHGKTRAEAAAELNRSEGTVASWLARGRKALAARLARRGVTLPATGLLAVVTPSAVSAELTSTAVATMLGRDIPAGVLALAEGVMRGLSTTSTKLAAVVVTVAALLGAVTTATAWPSEEPQPDAPLTAAATPPAPTAAPRPKPEREVKTFLDHKGFVYSVAYAPDGKTFLSVGNGSAIVWDAETRKKLFTIEAEFARFSDDGKALFYLTKDEFHVADATTGKSQRKFPRGMPKTAVGGRFATISGDGSARVEFDGGVHHITNYPVGGEVPPLHDQVEALALFMRVPDYGRGGAFAPGEITRFAGIHYATTKPTQTACLTIWKLHEGKRLGTISHPKHGVQAFAWSPDGKEIAVAFPDSLRIHDPVTQKELRKLDVSGATALAWSQDGKQLAVAVQEGISSTVENGMGASSSETVAMATVVFLLDSTTGKELRRIDGFPENLPVVSLAFRPEGKELVTAAGFLPNDGPPTDGLKPKKDAPGLRVIPLDVPKVEPNPGPVLWKETKVLDLSGWLGGSVTYSADGKVFFVGGTDGHIRAYEALTLKQLWEYKGGGDFSALALAPDGKNLAATFKGGVRFYDSTTGKAGDTLELNGSEPLAVAYFPDSLLPGVAGDPPTVRTVLVGTGRGYTLKSWHKWPDVKTTSLANLPANKQPVDPYAVPLAVAPNGQRAIMLGPIDKDTGKHALWAWPLDRAEATKVLVGHKSVAVSAAWSKNGKIIVTGDAAGLVIIWDATTFQEKSRLSLGGRVAAVAISADGFSVAAATVHPAPGPGKNDYTENVYSWLVGSPPEKPEPISSHKARGPFTGMAGLAFSPDGQQLVSCFANFTYLSFLGELVGKLRVLTVAPAPEKLPPPTKFVTDVSYSTDGKHYLALLGGKAVVFDTATGKQLYSVAGEAARFTADDKALVVFGEKQISYHDVTSGRATIAYDHPKWARQRDRVAFAPDGKRFVADLGLHAEVYDVATGRELAKLDNRHEMLGTIPGQAAKQLVFSPDGKKVALVGVQLTESRQGAAVWDSATGKRLHTFPADKYEDVRTAAFGPDGATLAVGFADRVEVWAIEGEAKKNPVLKFPTKEPVTALAYSKDGKQLAIGVRANSYDRWWADVRAAYKGEVLLIDVAAATELRRLTGFPRDSVLIDGKDLRESKELGPDEIRKATGFWVDPLVTAIAFSPDGKAVVAGTGTPPGDGIPVNINKGGEVKTFDLTAPQKPAAGRQWTDAVVLNDHKGLVRGVAVAPDGKSFAAATDRGITCWDAATRKVLWTYKSTVPAAYALAYSTDGKHLCIAMDTDVTRLDAKTGMPDPWTDDNAIWFGEVKSLAYHPTENRLAASSGYHTRVRELGVKGVEATFGKIPKGAAPVIPSGVAWSRDGKRLALIHNIKDGDIFPVVLWEVDTKPETVSKLQGHRESVTAVVWSADGKVIASGDEKGTVVLWNAGTGKELWRKQFRGRDDTDGHINALAFSPADNTLAVAVSMGSGKGPERVVLLDGKTGKDVEHIMRPWSHVVTSLAWSKDGAFLVTGCGLFPGKVPNRDDPPSGEVVVWEYKP